MLHKMAPAPKPTDPPRLTTRRFDPNRRERIVGAALSVIADVGVSHVTHRLIAKQAGVPLGSMTYHFDNLDEIIWLAFEKFSVALQARAEEQLCIVSDTGDELDGIVAMVSFGDADEQRRDSLLILELYVLAIRHPKYHILVEQWMASTKASLERHFSGLHLEVIDAIVEGFFIHRTFSPVRLSRESIKDALVALVSKATEGSAASQKLKPFKAG